MTRHKSTFSSAGPNMTVFEVKLFSLGPHPLKDIWETAVSTLLPVFPLGLLCLRVRGGPTFVMFVKDCRCTESYLYGHSFVSNFMSHRIDFGAIQRQRVRRVAHHHQ